MKIDNKEFEFLISLCKSTRVYQPDLLVNELENISWGKLLDISIRHSLLATLSHHIAINHEILYSKGLLNHPLRNFFIREKQHTHYLKKIMIETIIKVSKMFDEEGILYVVNKGLVLDTHVHYGDGRRDLGSDIDFMILPEDRDRVFNTLKKHGAVVGKHNSLTGKLVEHSRQEVLTYKLNPDHLLRFVLSTGKDFINYIDIDIANSITWHNSDMQVSMRDAFKEITSINVEYDDYAYTIHKFNNTYEFLFVIMHLYREAWFFKRSLQWNSDVNLKKFFDVYQYLTKYRDQIFNKIFYDKIKSLGVLKPFKWVVLHTDNIFDSDFSKMLDITDIDKNYLNGAFTSQGKIIQWKGDMKARLIENNRNNLFI